MTTFYEDLLIFCKAKYTILWAPTSEEIRLICRWQHMQLIAPEGEEASYGLGSGG